MTDDWLGNYNDPLPKDVEVADFTYWSRSPAWSFFEAISLALGADPASATVYVNGGYDRHRERRKSKPSFVLAFERMHHLIEKNFRYSLRDKQLNSLEFVGWLQRMNLPLPDGLEKALGLYAQPLVDWRAAAEAAQSENKQKSARIAKLESAIADNALAGSSNTKEREKAC